MPPRHTAKDTNDLAHESASPTARKRKRTRAAARVRVGGRTGVGVRKQPRQQRSKHMVEAILVAAAEVFAQLGYARATTNKIAERAGVSVGSLYQYFPNKDSLLAGLLQQHHADVDEVVAASLARLADPRVGLEEGLREFLMQLVALHECNPALTRALSAGVLRESPAADQTHKDDHHDDDGHGVIRLLANRPDVRDGDHASMAAVMRQATSQLTRWLVHEAPSELDRATLLEETVQLLARYLKK